MKICYEGNLGDKERDYCLSCDNNISPICMSCHTYTDNGVPTQYVEIGSIPKKSNVEMLKAMSVEQLAEWLDDNGMWDNSPWSKYFDEKYCQQCESVKAMMEGYFGNRECEFAYCELENKCRYFENHKDVPDCKEIIKMWLESETEE